MKSLFALFIASSLAAPMLFAQSRIADPSPSSPSSSEKPLNLMPSQTVTPPPAEDIPLIPDSPNLGDGSKKKKAEPTGPSRTDAAEDALQMHIRLRAAKTKALEDPVIQAELAKARKMKTDYDQREVYKRYYVLLYARMLKIDPTIAAGLPTRESTSLSRQYQLRVAPTVPRDQINLPTPAGPENVVTPEPGTAPEASAPRTPAPRKSSGRP